MNARTSVVLRALFLAVAFGAGSTAGAQTTECIQINSLPYVASISGVHCLKQNLNTNIAVGNGIAVTAQFVVIELNGYTILNLAGSGAGASVGVFASNKQNVTVRNGRLIGFRTGVSLAGAASRGHVVENVNVESPLLTGIKVDGKGATVKSCTVRGVGTSDEVVIGIQVQGAGNVIEKNVVADIPSANGRGVEAYGSDHLIVDNRVLGTSAFGYGLFLTNSPSTKYRDNLVTGTGTAYVGGTDAGNNQ